MGITESLLILAGYVLAHSAYSISDVPEGELLCPLAIVESSDGQRLIRFEAETQEEAIANAKGELEKLKSSSVAWAFGRESIIRDDNGNPRDFITVSAWSEGLEVEVYILQQFKPYYIDKEFKLIGEIEIAIDGKLLEKSQTKELIEIINSGIEQHPQFSAWQKWRL